MRAFVALALVACSQPAKPPVVADQPPAGSATSQPPVDAPGPSQDEKLAAIQKAMNELDEAAQGCWAVAATDRFDIEGDVTMMIDIAAGSAKASVVTDTARNAKLSKCLVELLSAYRWAPPLYGETIQLPFKFKAPDGQSVIDRNLVEWHGQQGISVAVLLDENNSANAAASMFAVTIDAGSRTGIRVAERPELWYFVTPARVEVGQTSRPNPPSPDGTASTSASVSVLPTITGGDMMYVPKGAVRNVSPVGQQPVKAVIVVAPGGREGTARGGALPTPAYDPKATAAPSPKLLPATGAKTYGPATIFLEPAVAKDAPYAGSILTLASGAAVPEHVHANETEILFVLEGSGTITINGQPIAVTSSSVLQIPPNTKHAFAATAAFRALQIYTPPGPEQRFKKKP